MVYLLLAVGVVAIGGAGGWLFMRSRQPKAEEFFYYRCDSCKRKLKYTARQINRKGMCPMCKKQFVFPAASNTKA